MKNKIGIACLLHRRSNLLESHLKQLSQCKNKNFYFYVYSTEKLNDYYKKLINYYLPENSLILDNFFEGNNYMNKMIDFCERGHEYCIKMDEDCILTSDGWDQFFDLIYLMKEDDLFCTGAISSGIPTCDLFIENFLTQFKKTIDPILKNTKFYDRDGVAYSRLNYINYVNEEWNSDLFFENVWKLNHHYLGVHPIRFNKFANIFINDLILKLFPKSMQPIKNKIIKDKNKYPYFCNNFIGIRNKDLKNIINSKNLYVDGFDEVPLNKYRLQNEKSVLIDAGIPIIHTLYNWHSDSEYETTLIDKINKIFGNIK